MKKGFSIEIQLDLTEEEKAISEAFAEKFTHFAIENNFEYPLKGSGGYDSFLKRGTFGFLFDRDNTLVFRRISTKQRRFAIVKAGLLLDKKTNEHVVITRCVCPKCLGLTEVIWNRLPETYTYVMIGDIKG